MEAVFFLIFITTIFLISYLIVICSELISSIKKVEITTRGISLNNHWKNILYYVKDGYLKESIPCNKWVIGWKDGNIFSISIYKTDSEPICDIMGNYWYNTFVLKNYFTKKVLSNKELNEYWFLIKVN
jgi:hypothetical protein